MGIVTRKQEPQMVVNQKFDGDVMDDFNNVVGMQDQSAGVELVRELNSPENIKMKSDVKSMTPEHFYYARLYGLSILMNWKELKTVADNELELKVSADRKGRKESVDAVRAIPHEQKGGGFMRRMFG